MSNKDDKSTELDTEHEVLTEKNTKLAQNERAVT